MANRRKPRTESACEGCGKSFTHIVTRPRRFCSRDCIVGQGVLVDFVEKTCPTCNTVFSIPLHEQKRIYCSRVCANARKQSQWNYAACLLCGKQFKIEASSTKYCSRQCNLEHTRRKPRTCPFCKETFAPSTTKQKYCSPQCQAEGRKSQTEITCKSCGKAFYVVAARLSRTLYCSLQCRLSHQFYSREEHETVAVVSTLLNEDPQTQFTFPWLISKRNRPMHVDAYFAQHNLAIEYDGKQHRQFLPHYHKTRRQFEELQERDRLKEQLLQEHGVLLLRIQDNEPRTPEYIKQKLADLKLIL